MNPPAFVVKAWGRAKVGYSLSIGQITAFVKLRKKTPKSGPVRICMQKLPREMPAMDLRSAELNSLPRQRCLIVGAGPQLGSSLARRFGSAGFDVVVARRQSDLLAPLIRELSESGIRVAGLRCDATDDSSVRRLFAEATEMFGVPDCVIFNVEAYSPGTILEICPSAFEDSWRGNYYAGFLVGKYAAQSMSHLGRGTIIFTGATASTRGKQGYINLAVGKCGLRALAQSMARELGPLGIHVSHVVLDGGMKAMRSDAVAENYLHLHNQPKSAWTHELDLRTSVEPW